MPGGQRQVVVDRLRHVRRRAAGRPPASASVLAEDAVSSPPIVIRWSIAERRRATRTHVGEVLGLLGRIRARGAAGSSRRAGGSRATRVLVELAHVAGVALHDPLEAVEDADHARAAARARVVAAAPITPLMPGAGPPPTRIPIRAHRPASRSLGCDGQCAAQRTDRLAARQARGPRQPRRARARPLSEPAPSPRSPAPRPPDRASASARCCRARGAGSRAALRLARVEHLDARAAREMRRVARPAAPLDLVEQPVDQVQPLALQLAAQIDQREHHARAIDAELRRARAARSPCRPPRARTSRRRASGCGRPRNRRLA